MAKILVVDDDEGIVEVLTFILSRKKYDVCVAYNGKEGLAMAKSEKPDLIVLDIMMPIMDGVSACGILFQDPVLRMIPVLILTAKESSQDLFALLPNVRLYMTKPFDPPTFLQNVQRLLGTSSSSAPMPTVQPTAAKKIRKTRK